MVKEIVKDTNILMKKSTRATKEDLYIVQDLIDTAEAHKERCCGLAAIQLGYEKNICIILKDDKWIPFINPVVSKRSTSWFENEEVCMSLEGTRKTKRYDWVEVVYLDRNFKAKKMLLTNFPAVIIQHEMDHLKGVLI